VVETLHAAGQLVTVEGSGTLTPEIEYVLTGGHTRDHQAFRLQCGGRLAVFAGDVLSTPGQVMRRYVAKYDFDGERAAAERERIARNAADEGQLLLFYHSPAAKAGFVHANPRGGLSVEPAGVPNESRSDTVNPTDSPIQ
jgi:glyoxylase-like metal-dependent hydrolase (beta-lactamase superfamily II)